MSEGTFHFRPLPLATQVCQAIGITTSAFLAGYLVTISSTTAAVTKSHGESSLALQWLNESAPGTSLLAYFASIPIVCFAYLAIQSRRKPAASLPPASAPALYTAAACIIPALIPFSLIFISPTETTLYSANPRFQTATSQLVDLTSIGATLNSWIMLNYIRAMLPALGSIFGITAVVIRPEIAAFATTNKA